MPFRVQGQVPLALQWRESSDLIQCQMEVCDEDLKWGRVDAVYEEVESGFGAPVKSESSKTFWPILAD